MRRVVSYLLPALMALAAIALIAGCGRQPRSAPQAHQSGQTPKPPAPTVSYGISQDYLEFTAGSAAKTFAAKVLGNDGHVRLFVPYDTRGYWNGSQCANSPAYGQGASDWNALAQELSEANDQHLRVEIVFAGRVRRRRGAAVPGPGGPGAGR